MAVNPLLSMLREGKTALGLFHMYSAAGIIEGMCRGWDYVLSDMQHGQHDYATALASAHAAGSAGLPFVVRAPGHEPSMLGRIADMSPAGIMTPMVNTAAQAEAIVRALRFAPRGERSYGGRRVLDVNGREYYRQTEIMVIAQIETQEAADAAGAIIRTDGVDCVFFGPDDMKVQLGIPINTTLVGDPRLKDALARTAKAARDAGKFSGTAVGDPASIEFALEQGCQFLIGGADIVFLREGATARLAAMRQAVERKPPAAVPNAARKQGGSAY